MPEGIEAELYRASAATTIGRVVADVELADPTYTRGGLTRADLADALTARRVIAVRRHGKVVFIDLGSSTEVEVTLALRFGMTGRLIVDGHAAIESLEYSSGRNDPSWDRFGLRFEGHGSMVIRDQRRLGSVELEPDETALGPDVFGIDASTLAEVLRTSSRPLKSRLLDQAAIAGLGNLLCDEVLWRASLHPGRPSNSLGRTDIARLAATIRVTLEELTARGGSHTGDLQQERHRFGRCPIDGAQLELRTIGGRTTYACPDHQAGMELSQCEPVRDE